VPGKPRNFRIPTDLLAEVDCRLEELNASGDPLTRTDAVVAGLRRWLMATDPTRSVPPVVLPFHGRTVGAPWTDNGTMAAESSGGGDLLHVAQDVAVPPAAPGLDRGAAPARSGFLPPFSPLSLDPDGLGRLAEQVAAYRERPAQGPLPSTVTARRTHHRDPADCTHPPEDWVSYVEASMRFDPEEIVSTTQRVAAFCGRCGTEQYVVGQGSPTVRDHTRRA